MADDQPTVEPSQTRRSWLMWFPLGIAALSLVSSIFQSVNYSRQIESAQRNVLRVENLKTCKEVIEVFFQFRLKAEEANRLAVVLRETGKSADDATAIELKSRVYKFGALSTFLANFRDEDTRYRYTQLSWELLSVGEKASKVSADEFTRIFNALDKSFDAFNQDCVKSAQSRLL
jgi:hypothetical protein